MQIMNWFGIILLNISAGTLVNYLADVLPISRKLTAPLCSQCEKQISLFNYILLKPCLNCGKPRILRALLVHIFLLISGSFLWIFTPLKLGYPLTLLLLVLFTLIIVTDFEYQVVLFPVTIAGAVLGLVSGFHKNGLLPSLLGGAVGFGIMLSLYFLGIGFKKLLTHIRKKEIPEEALGFGDVTLCGILGLILGYPDIIPGIIFGIMLGGLISAGYLIVKSLLGKYQLLTALPYAPFLVLSAGALLFILQI